MANAADDRSYSGLLGAFPYAFRRSGSLLFKLYAAVGGLLAAGVAVIFALALVVLIADTAAASGGTISLMRAFFVVVALLVVGPLVAPVLFVARRHRRGSGDRDRGADATYDRRLAVSGFAFAASVYVALIVSTPPAQQVGTDGTGGALLEALYALPAPVGLLLPVVAALAIYAVHLRSR
ncbi:MULTISPECIES: hypothetical protein [Saliphagus]|uniref:DUF8056 domain-containing protein n=1 Tax=Saliphagus infecundisoli TaxID=1849069 RepID=A0ABD5QIS8_9EURY|nr:MULTISPECIES: hypothetical protein [Saliphagus]